MSQVKIGFINLPAPLVLEHATQTLADLKATKAANAEAFVQRIMNAPMGWIGRVFNRKPMTREQAVEAIDNDTWLRHEMYWLIDYISPKEAALTKLVNVANNTNGEMTVAIEVANWFYKELTTS